MIKRWLQTHFWQPAHTAPKDGTFILVQTPGNSVLIMQWCNVRGRTHTGYDNYWRTHVDNEHRWEVKYWRYLPKPLKEYK